MFDPHDDAQRPFHGYGPAPLPDPRDEEVARFVATLVTGGPSAVAGVRPLVTEQARRVLCAYAERMASLAVRRHDPKLLVGATVALVVGGLDENRHESLMVMAPLEDSAKRLGVDLPDLFKYVSKIVGHPGTVNLAVWLMRRPEDRTLASMRFVSDEDQDGFRYRLDW